jgi:hypothetical protein
MIQESLPTQTRPAEKSLSRFAWIRMLPILTGVLFVLAVIVGVGAYLFLTNLDNIGTFQVKTALADLDGDGDQDVLLHNIRIESEFTAFGGPTLWFNQGGGRFSRQELELGGWASAPGDVDQDGDADLVIFVGERLEWALNQGGELMMNNSAMAPLREMQFGSILTGDLNGDRQVDAVVLGCCGRAFPDSAGAFPPNTSWTWINQWKETGRVNPGAAPLPALDGLPIGGAALGDLDGDGDLDLLAGILSSKLDPALSQAARVLLNDGAGSFADSGQRLGDSETFAVALGDLDGDGDLDALLGRERGAEIWINPGRPGEFTISGQKFSDEKITATFLSDLDRDGDLDAVLAGAQSAHVWRNDGKGSFTRSSQELRFSDRKALAVGDFTGDEYPDIVAVDSAGSWQVWVNQADGTFTQGG